VGDKRTLPLRVRVLRLPDWPTMHFRLPPWSIGQRIRALRMWRELSSRQVAPAAGISAVAWCKWERGLTHLGSRQILAAAKVLDVRICDIVPSPGHRDIILDRYAVECCCPNCSHLFREI